ncbi:MAG: nitroreductase family protein [Sphingomonas bacterium]|nr:nitroreductase family protein [Sphingomonas bacterium]
MNRRQMLIAGGVATVLGAGAGLFGLRQAGLARYDDAQRAVRAPLGLDPRAHDLVRFATLAPNGHNAQPWRFALAPQRITIRPDFARRTPVVDPDDHHLFISLGCAAENLALAASASGRRGEAVFDPAGDGAIAFDYRPGAAEPSLLFDAIARRQSTRADYDGRGMGSADLAALAAAAAMPGVDLVLVTDRLAIDRVRDLILAGNDVQMADPAFLRELKRWLRFSPHHALESGDGLYSAASGSPALPDWIGPRAFDMMVSAKSEKDKYARQLNSSSGLAIFVGAAEDRGHWVRVGHACQRFALQATALGMKLAFVNQPVEVARFRPELAKLIGLPGRRPDLVMRFGYGPALPYAPRRAVERVITA